MAGKMVDAMVEKRVYSKDRQLVEQMVSSSVVVKAVWLAADRTAVVLGDSTVAVLVSHSAERLAVLMVDGMAACSAERLVELMAAMMVLTKVHW